MKLDRLLLVGAGMVGFYYVPHVTGIVLGVLAPTFIAYYRRHRNVLAISVLNLVMAAIAVGCFLMAAVLGLVAVFPVGIGWVISLIWACTSNVEPRDDLKIT